MFAFETVFVGLYIFFSLALRSKRCVNETHTLALQCSSLQVCFNSAQPNSVSPAESCHSDLNRWRQVIEYSSILSR
ncbi:hypothetical protein B0H16DRAFT_1541799 [Mycena metata]|uniref:Secreted protein n=1 Tax=Mycena metata TaxID=1033252 RepID=A0AAD7J329_9AGAR|nr:hypothetical protein B0H16DRAFT_1541799 [Mycena metata]